MELSGTRVIAATRRVVWDALNDPAVLRRSIPGCTELTGSAKEGFSAVVTQKIGPVKATFRGKVTISDIVEGESYRISGEGKGGAAGYARGSAKVVLDAADGGTKLSYEVEAMVGGKLASLGARLIDGVAKKLADQFFDNFKQAVEPAQEETVEAIAAPAKGLFARITSWFRRFTGQTG